MSDDRDPHTSSDLAPGDEVPPETPGAGEDVCPACGGTGRQDDGACPACQGRGTTIEAVGGG